MKYLTKYQSSRCRQKGYQRLFIFIHNDMHI